MNYIKLLHAISLLSNLINLVSKYIYSCELGYSKDFREEDLKELRKKAKYCLNYIKVFLNIDKTDLLELILLFEEKEYYYDILKELIELLNEINKGV